MQQRSTVIGGSLEEKTAQICLQQGLIAGIKYYKDEKTKEQGSSYSLKAAKGEVEALLDARGLRNSISKPKSGALMIIILMILISMAIGIYLFSRT
ncbi:hypothetical protein F0L74_24955 [Chitinophaga agrisoli]|uniref:Uncharacterized protein n=1 Tax=Chitinophaga agrisoli TaxID=2607653 RepID=A0A5B2VIP2_9BACT|nr:hypothetical protein [Chitinophaga agrisoli]KAA2239453.1 hypothetical protein F0L74_24955 [Chitinophaga agrisoli]